MSEDEESRTNLVVREDSEGGGALQQELWPELLSLERQRIDNERQRVDLASQVIALRDASDQRQYEFHTEKLRRDDDDRKKKRRFGMRLVSCLLGIGVAYVGLCLYFLFYGDEAQRTSAMYLLVGPSAIVGGYGLLTAFIRGLDHLFGR
ncbi:MAG: hypothetical protein OXI49_17535 [Acidobacteriota bacterium]|nr:hypothetical protein [Acidobacteriota bacterium]